MHPLWKKASVFIWLMVFSFAFPLQSVFGDDAADGSATQIQKPSHYLVVTYFHTSFRCPSCYRIEKYSKDAIHFNFEDELKSGKIVWRVINVEEPPNRHFIKDYRLYSKHLIVSEVQDGKELRWKDLKEVWVKVRDEAQFNDYVKTEISDWLKE